MPITKLKLVLAWIEIHKEELISLWNLMHPFYQELNNTALFSQMYVENGELLWRTGQDFCPNTLYENSTLITA